MSQIIILYTLSFHNAMCQLYPNKIGGKRVLFVWYLQQDWYTSFCFFLFFFFFLHSNSYVGVSLAGYLFLCLFDICTTSLIVSVSIFGLFCNTLFLVLRVPVERYSLNIRHIISITWMANIFSLVFDLWKFFIFIV